jgi:tetraacyldisaccharide 4'-kinase
MRSPAFWWQPHLTLPALLLWPLGWLYGRVASAHGAWRAKHAYYAGVPVISIGNLVAGGSGKTPLVTALASHLAAQGAMVAVVLRGYGGTESARPLQVTFQHSARQVGDEAWALYQALPKNVQVWVGRHRPGVVRRAEQAGATVVVLDDGFQRRDVARTVDLLVLPGLPPAGQTEPHPFGNGLCLPAGPLREPMAAFARADFAVLMDAPPPAAHTAPPFFGILTYRLQIQPNPAVVAALYDKKLLAFAGLGRPEKFFRALRQTGLNVVGALSYADHVLYPPGRLAYIRQQARALGAELITTTKDAAKLPPGFAHVMPAVICGADWPNVLEAIALKLRGL